MDQNTALKILQNYGAPPTAANLSKVMSQSDSDSAVLGRSMGLQGGGQEQGNADNLKSLLDKLDTSTARPTTPDSTIAQAAPAETPATTGASVAQAATPTGTIVPSVAPEPLPIAQGVQPMPNAAPATPQGGPGGGLLPWLLPLLGITAGGGAAAGGAAPQMPGARAAIAGPDMNAPQIEGPRKQIEGPRRALPRMITNDGQGDKSSAESPDVQRQIEGPRTTPLIEDAGGKRFESGAPEIKNPPKPTPVRPQFSPTELLMHAVQDFQKGFRK